MKTVTGVDYVVIAAYMALMLGIGFYSARFNRGASDYFKGGNRIPWLVAGLSSFMSGFSAWTFTGAAGLAYQQGVVAILLYIGNALTFLLGYFVFAVRWRRARISTVMEYLVERFDERTRQAFSWTTVFFQLFTGASMLYGLGLFVASTSGLPLTWTIVGCGAVILAYCVVGGLWAVVITDFLQAVILMPFTLVMFFASLSRVGGFDGLLAALPPEMKSLSHPGPGWIYVLSWTVMVSFGYNTAAMAQRYFSVDDEASAKKAALLCFALFLLGAFIWFVPPLAMRVLYPDLHAVWPGLANPHEASYAVAALTLLPTGLVGIMLAAMFSATMSSLSGLFNMHSAVISKDIYQTLFARKAGERELMIVGWIATFGVGAAITAIAAAMAARGTSIFEVMLTFNTVMSLAYGPPALLGLVARRTPSWSGMASFVVGLALGCYGAFFAHWSLVQNVAIIIPASVAVFFASTVFEGRDADYAARRDAFFRRLDTPVDVAVELRASPDPTAAVFRFLARLTAGVGVASLLLVAYARPGERSTVIVYVAITLAIAAALALVRGGRVAILLLAAVLGARAGEAGVAAVWAVNDGEKIERDDLAHPAKARNSAWDGKTVRLFGGGNEILAFQVMVEADAKGISALSVSLPELRRRGGAERIAYAPPAADPADTVGREVQLFSVHYMNVTEPTNADWAWKPHSPAAPKDPTGWKPVQLVPENARAGRGGFPLKVAPRQNQAIWVEVYTGRDRPPGTYEGVVTLKADGQVRRVPVELELMAFTLPDENSMDAMVYYEPSQPELYQGRNLDDVYHRFAHRQRVELVHAYDQAGVRAHFGRFDGADFTKARGYEGPGEGVGNRIVPVSFYGPGRGWEDRPTAWSRSDAWMGFLSSVLPKAITFLYMPDEPRRAQFPEIVKLADNVRSNPGPGRRLPLFVTRSWAEELDGSIDMWSTGPQHFDIARAAQERGKGRYYWTYNGGRPAAGAMTIDAPATDPRATIWACFKHGVEVYFYWHGVHWRHNSQKQGERNQNVWANPITFDNRGQPNKEDFGTLNGDGVLLYPGEEKLHPEEDRGIAGPVATIQLASFRRGLQDHQYLTLARKRGLTGVVDEALRAVVPRVFSDAGETVSFAETGDAFESVRRKLAEAIASRSGPAPSASAAPGTGVSRPRLLIAERDPFSGLPALRARWAAGDRPSDDLAGWALSYLLSGDEAFARRAVDELRRAHPSGKGSSSLYMDTLKFALAFDWLYGYSGFDDALKDRLAAELVAQAERELANPLLADPEQVAYHNHFVRYLTRAAIALYAVEGHASVEARAAPMREKVRRALDNVLDSSEMVTPDGGYHESMDYMRITFAPLALLAEMRRTMGGDDPARRYGVFRHMGGETYLYKVEPDGTTSRDDDNEWPHLQALDNVVLGYAIHRFKDPYAAWIQRESGWVPKDWTIPILQFLWSDATVVARDPARTTDTELPRAKLFRGIGHFVMRDGWGPDSTWIEFDAGPFFAKHDHLDQGHFVIHHKGDLAIDSGADYTDTESPHYLNYYRRTVAHNSMLVYEPGETFFWGENLLPAANDGGQRMDSSRYWNTVRSREDFRRTRDLWDVARMDAAVHRPGAFDYARGDITRAYHPSKMERFTRELVYTPTDNVLFVFDRVRATDPAFRKAWLIHGVNQPRVDGSVFTFEERKGRLRVHSLLPAEAPPVARGGPGQEFWTPGDEKGGAWGSGQSWPLIPFEGGPLPEAPDLRHMWKTFWGQDLERISPSNARSVVPGAWRVEVSPSRPAKEDHFLHVIEIGDAGDARARRVARVQGHRLEGALVEGGTLALFDAQDDPLVEGEVTLPDVGAKTLLVTGLVPRTRYELQLTPNTNPGAPMWRQVVESDESGLVHLPWDGHQNARLRLRRIEEERR